MQVLGMHMRIICLTQSTWKISGKIAKCGRDDMVLTSTYLVHRSASKMNRSGADVQAVSCYCYLVIFHPFVEQLTVLYISGLVL